MGLLFNRGSGPTFKRIVPRSVLSKPVVVSLIKKSGIVKREGRSALRDLLLGDRKGGLHREEVRTEIANLVGERLIPRSMAGKIAKTLGLQGHRFTAGFKSASRMHAEEAHEARVKEAQQEPPAKSMPEHLPSHLPLSESGLGHSLPPHLNTPFRPIIPTHSPDAPDFAKPTLVPPPHLPDQLSE